MRSNSCWPRPVPACPLKGTYLTPFLSLIKGTAQCMYRGLAEASCHILVMAVLQEAAKGRAVPLSCLKLAIDSAQLLLMWSLSNLEQSSPPSSTAITAMSKAVASFAGQLDAMGAAEDDGHLQKAIQQTQSNLYLVFSARKLKV